MKYLIWIAALVFGMVVTVTAQDPPALIDMPTMDELLLSQAPPDSPMGGNRRGFGPGAGAGMPGERQMRHLEQFRLLKLLEFLDLKEDQEAQFISKYRQMRKEEREADQRERDLVTRLADRVKEGKTAEKVISAMVDSIMQIQEQSWKARQNRLQQFKSVLTVEQWARFIIFHERFEQEMLEQVRGFRGRELLQRQSKEDRAKQEHDSDKF